ncbi:MAG: carbonic anhydrase family protein [Bacteroidetes bacterium]|nr:carbonic anhydrase family protein [Bacteroidota bacterium]
MKYHTKETQSKLTPKSALQILKEGNLRFINNLKLSRNLLEQAGYTAEKQYPFAIILSCIDSRTSSELIFDQGLGDIFSVRIAGNIINEDILGSMEFACKIAGAKIILVLGHTECGAIKGACDHIELGNLTALLSKIQPAVYDEKTEVKNRNSSNKKFVEKVTIINIHRTVEGIEQRSAILKEMIEKGEVIILGAIHEIVTGRVVFFEN